ncbi:hypothetical protein FACS18949_18000 [Clostridia bacterium]|nr:hypothetical protein FACS18949_18000 [Clostridia bacterium]
METKGMIEVTAEHWLHIRLDMLLPSVRYSSTQFITDAITALLADYEGELPFFEQALLVIDEHSNDDTRQVFDQDNKAWKAIPNALKIRVFNDDDQYTLAVCLLSERSEEVCTHVYVLPPRDAFWYFFGRYNDTPNPPR